MVLNLVEVGIGGSNKRQRLVKNRKGWGLHWGPENPGTSQKTLTLEKELTKVEGTLGMKLAMAMDPTMGRFSIAFDITWYWSISRTEQTCICILISIHGVRESLLF